MKKFFKYFTSFIVPIIIFCICLKFNNIAPLGEYRITIYDSQVQYPAFFLALKNMHFYLFNVGFGFNFLGTFTYYLMSPLNLLIHIFDLKNYNTFYFLLIIIKMGLCGLTMQYFLAHEEKSDNLWSVIFSIIYALIGFIATYFYNVFWLDGIIMLPLVLVGINKIIENKSSLFYIICLSLSIILSFYTGYISCIFCVIYFIYKLIEKNKYKDKKTIFRFLISSLIAGLIGAIVLIPSFFALSTGKISGYTSGFTKYFEFNSNIKYLFHSFLPGNFQSNSVSYGFAQNFCTLFVVTLFITSFFNKNINFKTKIVTLSIVLFYLLSYSFNLVDFAWQFFQKPVWWQHRYSFTFSLFIIIIAYKNLMNHKNQQISNKTKVILFIVLAIMFTASFLLFYNNLDVKNIYRIIIFAFSILLLLNYLMLFNLNSKFKYFIILFIFLELFTNTFISVKESNNKNYLSMDIKTKEDKNKQVQKVKQLDDSFYKMELISKYTYNDGLLFNYNGINYFNSVRNQNIVKLMEDYLNLTVDSHCSFILNKLDPYILSLFNIKYLVGNENIYYFPKIEDGIYQNKYPLALGFMSKNDVNKAKLKKKYFYDNITNIYQQLLGENIKLYSYLDNKKITLENAFYNEEESIYERVDSNKDSKAIIEFRAPENSFIINDYNILNTIIYVNNIKVDNNSSYIYVRQNDEVKIENTLLKVKEKRNLADVHYIKEKTYQEIMNKLSSNLMEDIKVNTNHHTFSGTINVDDDKKFLFTTIAYEKGMIIKVNGKKVKPNLIFNAFVGLKLKPGKNKITIDYIPRGLISGVILTITGIILAIIYTKKFEKKLLK